MKNQSSSAIVSKAIKAILKKEFPAVKFSVTSDGGSCVRISYTNGPTVESVESLSAKFKMGTFDGMTDSYDYNNRNTSIEQVQYIFASRTITEDIKEQTFELIKKTYDGIEGLNRNDWSTKHQAYVSELIGRITYKTAY